MPELEGFFRRFLDNEFYSISDSFGITETDNEMGNMVETAFFLQWMHRENLDLKYARWKMGRSEGEVDIVLLDNKLFQPQWCVEIKWSNRYFEKPQELKSLIYFCNQNNFSASLVTTIDILDNKTIEDINLTYVPAAVYAYNIGVNTLELKSNW
ncbi:ATPase -like protein [Galbibacter marinus]|uniref:ATPase-like protein n=2 Tax=Galbibacter marinus TaxID=555500 RepID=K2PSQ0_9FLAO|nr:ATPase -like protein [Galbibacter marinus]